MKDIAKHVYSFSLIMFYILTRSNPYCRLSSSILIRKYVAEDNERPFLKNQLCGAIAN